MKPLDIKPLFKHILVQTAKEKGTTESGIILPTRLEKEMPEEGMVVAIADDCKQVKVKDIIIFPKYVPTEIEMDGRKYLIIKEDEVLAIIK